MQNKNRNFHFIFWSKLADLLPSQTIVLQKLAQDCLTLIIQKASLSTHSAEFEKIIADLQSAEQNNDAISSAIEQLKEKSGFASDFDRVAIEVYTELSSSLKEIISNEDYLELQKILE